jgi:cytochrome c oxidase subunit 4
MADQHSHESPGAHVHGGITMKTGDPHAAHHEEGEHSHPSWKFYVLIGVILTIVTAVEVAIFYIPQLSAVLVPTLLILSVGKFILVVMFYMHLKFDHPVFSRVFVAPLFLAVLVVIGMIILFKVLPAYDVYR